MYFILEHLYSGIRSNRAKIPADRVSQLTNMQPLYRRHVAFLRSCIVTNMLGWVVCSNSIGRYITNELFQLFLYMKVTVQSRLDQARSYRTVTVSVCRSQLRNALLICTWRGRRPLHKLLRAMATEGSGRAYLLDSWP